MPPGGQGDLLAHSEACQERTGIHRRQVSLHLYKPIKLFVGPQFLFLQEQFAGFTRSDSTDNQLLAAENQVRAGCELFEDRPPRRLKNQAIMDR